jgi:exo-beta-1,3-glucanase (GH17 family)/cbb3-type cytochrome oxidase subunit 3
VAAERRPATAAGPAAPDRAGAAPGPGPVRRAVVLALLALAALAALLHGWRMSVPVSVGEPGAERVECVSYAPFRRPGETPFDPRAFVSEARIETDLRLLASRTACVRTYSVSQGLHAVPAVAQRLGMTVLLGAWIGRDRRENDAEVQAAIGIAREHAGTVRAVVVGNEVMLRRELPEAELVGYIERVRRGTSVPVTYADVWEFWLQHPSLAPAVSFVTIHILPYWEDEPVGIDAAIAHVVEVWRDMQRRLPGREILVGETGWPSEGRARHDAEPGRVEQARFVRQFTRAAAEHGIRYNLIEAFDQPWKRALEGAMGGAWGLLDSDGRPKFDWHGPVAPREGWTAWRTAALAGALLGAIAFALAGRGRGAALHAAVGAIAGAGLGATLAEQARYLVVWNRWPAEWSASLAATAIVLAACIVSALWLARRLGGDAAAPLPPASAAMRGWLRSERHPGLDGWVSMLHAAVLFCAATTVVLHAFDGRYRGFDWPLFAPAAVAAALAWIAGASRAPGSLEERWLGGVLLAGAALMVAKEGPANAQALGYAALMAVLGACALARTSTSSPSSAPTAAGSLL